MSYTF